MVSAKKKEGRGRVRNRGDGKTVYLNERRRLLLAFSKDIGNKYEDGCF